MRNEPAAGRPRRRAMVSRDTAEEHRVATPLELFFDLCFVVAVAQAGSGLHHSLAAGEVRHALIAFSAVFFAVWWAWMNFTWFASAFDTDDIPYRLAVFVQIAGNLTLAAGVPAAFDDGDFTVATIGYVIMRTGLVTLWLRASRDDPRCRVTCRRYAAGVALCQAGWLLLLAVPDEWKALGWLVLVPAELAVPAWAERAAPTAWHPHHIAERYGLFTLIVLGESVLAASLAIEAAVDAGAGVGVLLIAAGGLLVVLSMWWLYFSKPIALVVHRIRERFGAENRFGFIWGYGHYAVFASAAAVGAGIAVAVEQATDHSTLTTTQAGLTVAVPTAIFILGVWFLHVRPITPPGVASRSFPCAAGVVVLTAWLPRPVLAIGLLLAAYVAALVVSSPRHTPSGAS